MKNEWQFFSSSSASVALSQNPGVTYLKGGTVIDMTGKAPYQADLEIRGETIEAIGRELAIPEGTKVLDISGEYILPGFADMHAHVTFVRPHEYSSYDRATTDQVLKMLLAYGITTGRNPAAPAVESVRLRDDLEPRERF